MAKGKKSGSAALAFIFLLPLVAIVIYLVMNFSSVITLDNVTKITISAPNSEDKVFESQEDISYFVNVLTGSLSINSAMRDVSGEAPVYIICHREDKSIEYKFYPSLNLSGCLLIAPDGKLYVLENETAKNLLLREEFDYLYANYFLPKLNVISGENVSEIHPVESTWSYYKSDDIAYSYTPAEYATGEESYTVLKGFENTLSFTPDKEVIPFEMSDFTCVSENGSEYNLKDGDISSLDLSVDTLLTVSFTAKWSSKSGARAFGEAKYKFNLMYDIPAVLELEVKDYTVGDVIAINASNLNSDEAVEIETLLDISGVKFDVVDELAGTGVALLPIGLNNSPGDYTINLQTGINSINETLIISAVDSGTWTPIEASTEDYNQMLSPEKLSEFRNALAEITAQRPKNPDVNAYDSETEKFYLNSPVNEAPVFEYGQKINLGVADISGDSGERTCEGLIYELSEGASVCSAQAGVVVYCGELAPTGKTVVVYHGYGIYSYYFHLESTHVGEGYVLGNGEVLGTAGQTGFTAGKTALNFCVSIDGTFVNPNWFIGE